MTTACKGAFLLVELLAFYVHMSLSSAADLRKDISLLQASRRGGCSVDLSQIAPANFDGFVCDTMPGGWYHSDGSSWFPATAGSGGCHIYKFLTGPKPECAVGDACPSCEDPNGQVVKEFFLVQDGCMQPSSCAGQSPAGR
mmetsp:Transcript_116403/g.184165  ORF Transcript_116403/g.184165 Transcript_116403/m.184165 type:complete len:141 (-) Transcript_116403:48-470(-)